MVSSPFDPQGAFLNMGNISLAPRMGNIWPLDLLFKQALASLCFCHDYYLKVFALRDKAWLYTVSVPSISQSKQEADCKCLTWGPPNSCLRKCKQASSKCLAWSPLVSCPMKCKQEASCKCLAWSPPKACLNSMRWTMQQSKNQGYRLQWGFPGGLNGKESACNLGDLVWSLGREEYG